MKDLITPKIKAARRVMLLLKFFMVILDSLIIFALSSIVFTYIRKPIVYDFVPTAFVPAGVYFLIRTIAIAATIKPVQQIAWKYPVLNERLQTAIDNKNASNVIVDRLLMDVSAKLEMMSTSLFFETQSVSLRLIAVLILLPLSFSANIYIIDQQPFQNFLSKGIGGLPFGDLFGGGNGNDIMEVGGGKDYEPGTHENKKENRKIGGLSGGMVPGFNEGPLEGEGGGTGTDANKDIYGAPSSAQIEGRDVKMEVHPEYGGEVEIRDVGDEAAARSFTMPDEIRSAGSPEQEPVEYEEVIKRYFEKLSTEGGK